MSTPDIRAKLTRELLAGITTEVQVVYLLAGIRKLIERDGVSDQYPDLKFHCDWALHSKLEGTGAKAILRQFDAAHPLLKGGVELHKLPLELRSEINRISRMESFHKEINKFLAKYKLPPLTQHRPDGWAYFLHLYAKVVEDIPLSVSIAAARKNGAKPKAACSAPNVAPQHISQVTVHFEQARVKHPGMREEDLFKVTWRIHDKNGGSGDVFVINSFSQ
jgi:hypothetical protein